MAFKMKGSPMQRNFPGAFKKGDKTGTTSVKEKQDNQIVDKGAQKQPYHHHC